MSNSEEKSFQGQGEAVLQAAIVEGWVEDLQGNNRTNNDQVLQEHSSSRGVGSMGGTRE